MQLRNGPNWKSGLAGVVVLALPGLWVWAQEGDPFGTAPRRSDPAAAPAVKPAPGLRPAVADEKHPVVLAVRESNPSDPAAWLKATRMMADISRYDEAAIYLNSLAGASIDDATAFELHRQIGTGGLLELARIAELQPNADTVTQTILSGASRFARNPSRIDQLIAQLDNSSIRRRTEALDELRVLDADGIAAVLRNGIRAGENQRMVLVDTLQAWGVSVEAPLIAALKSEAPEVRSLAIEVLGRRQSAEALIWLLDPLWNPAVDPTEKSLAQEACQRILNESAPSKVDTVQRLHRAWQARELGLGSSAIKDLWSWNDAAGNFERVTVTAHELAVSDRARLAESLVSIDPDRSEFRLMAWRGRLAMVQRQVGTSREIGSSDLNRVDRPSVEELNIILTAELKETRPSGAIAAVDLLGELSDASTLYASSGEATPLVEALRHSDRTVRLAAARAILRLAPVKSFPGSNRVVPALCYFLKSQGSPRVLVGHPGVRETQQLVGSLRDLGYEADSAYTGRDLFQQAIAHPDYEMVLMSDAIGGPELFELLQQLRRDPRTAEIPVGLAVRYENLDRARQISRDEPRTRAFAWPHATEFVRLSLDEVQAVSGNRVPNFESRVAQSHAAMELLSVAAARPDVYIFEDLYAQEEMLIELLDSPIQAGSAVKVLGVLATPASQRALVALIGGSFYPMELRKSAVESLAAAIERRGLLLTTVELKRIYDLRNELGQSDPTSLDVLDQLLDAVEGPSGLSSRSRP